MKQLPRVCCLVFLALTTAACSSIPDVQNAFRELDLGSDTYVVRAGDTLESIAFRYDMQPAALLALNPSKGQRFAPGTHLYVREPTEQSRFRSSVAARSAEAQRIVPANSRSETVVSTAPVYLPRAVASKDYQVPANPTVYTPSGSAISSDAALLNPAGEMPRLKNGALDTEAYASTSIYPREEIIEESFNNGASIVTRSQEDSGVQRQGGGWMWPTQGQIARGFSPEKEGRHGVDIAGLPGQAVVAVKDGTVAYSGKDPSGTGNLIIVRHDDSLLTAYSHTQNLYVAEDDSVKAGDPIGTLGWNAQQESVLRFEVRQNGNSLNPMDFLSNR